VWVACEHQAGALRDRGRLLSPANPGKSTVGGAGGTQVDRIIEVERIGHLHSPKQALDRCEPDRQRFAVDQNEVKTAGDTQITQATERTLACDAGLLGPLSGLVDEIHASIVEEARRL
jgi:hypothetical protein